MSFWSVDVPVGIDRKKTGRRANFETLSDRRHKPKQAQKWRKQLESQPEAWKAVILPHQTRKKIEVAAIRVRETDNAYYRKPGKERWLLIERMKTSDGMEYKYHLSSFPVETAIRKLALAAHVRWKIEQGYQQLKEELGLDHFEGRSWLGFHHHITLCFMAYAFLQVMKQKMGKKKLLKRSTDSNSILLNLPKGNVHTGTRVL